MNKYLRMKCTDATCPMILNAMFWWFPAFIVILQKRTQASSFSKVCIHFVSHITIYKLVCYSWNHTSYLAHLAIYFLRFHFTRLGSIWHGYDFIVTPTSPYDPSVHPPPPHTHTLLKCSYGPEGHSTKRS